MQTTADKHLDKAEAYMKAAFKELSPVLSKEASGSYDYDDDTFQKIIEVYQILAETMNKLNRDEYPFIDKNENNFV